MANKDNYSIASPAERLSQNISNIFGDKRGAKKEAARAISVNYINFLNMLAGKRPVPQWIFDKLLIIGAAQGVPIFDSSKHKESDAIAIVAPALKNLVGRTEKAGWDRRVILSAIAEWQEGES